MIRDSKLSNLYCDICSKRILQIGGGFCYNDPICDFAICINCYDGVQKEISEVPFQREDTTHIRVRQVVEYY